MPKRMSNLGFSLMSLAFKIRDLLSPRSEVLKEAGIRPGFRVLDYGCGPGGYVALLADLVGSAGEVHALDIHPLAVRAVRRLAARRGLRNVTVIHSDCGTALPDGSLDAVLLYDVLHGLSRPEEVLREIHRVLKPDGIVSLSDHHMKGHDILREVSGSGLFTLARRGRRTFTFAKVGQ